MLASTVHTIEYVQPLYERAAKTLKRLGYRNISTYLGNGTLGLPEKAPFDAIIVTAGGIAIPDTLSNQLREGGRIVIPLGQTETSQQLTRCVKRSGVLHCEEIGDVRFVPLKGKHGWGA
jgi:protein-L-isoaspartate(D-aspartate) O-methyltransferase